MAIRTAVIGGGYMGHTHAMAIGRHPSAELSLVCDIDESVLDSFASLEWTAEYLADHPAIDSTPDLGSPSMTDDPEEVFVSNVDAVCICTPNAFHGPLAIDALNSGKHVMVEKPMATDAETAEQMIQAARENERALHVGHMWRHDGHVGWAKSLIQNGRVGDPVKLKGFGIHSDWGPDGWFIDPDLAGGGALLDMGVHAIDTAGFLLGDPQPTHVYASIETSFGDYDVDDDALIHISYEGGARAVIESGWRQPYKEGPESAIRFYGTDGYVSVFPTEARLNEGDERGWFDPDIEREHNDFEAYQRCINEFLQCIQDGTPQKTNAETAARVIEICDAAYESSETNSVVELEIEDSNHIERSSGESRDPNMS